MSLIPNHCPVRAILILTLRRHGLTGINRRRQTSHTPLITINRIIIIVLALPKPKRHPAHRRRALVTVPVGTVQGVQTPRHGTYPGRVGGGAIGRVPTVVGAGAAGAVARVGWIGSVDAVAVLGVGDYHAGQACESETGSATAATANMNAAAAAGGGYSEPER